MAGSGRTPVHSSISSGSSGQASQQAAQSVANTVSNVAESSGKAAEEAAEDIVDWVEKYLERASRATDIAVDNIERATTLSRKLTASQKAIGKVQEEITKNQQAKERYLAEANKVSLSSDIKGKVRNGSLDITNYDEDTKKKIDQYQEYYEKALEANDKLKELKDKEIELNQERLDYITDAYDLLVEVQESTQSALESFVELNNKLGYAIDDSSTLDALKKSIKSQNSEYNRLVQELSAFETEFNSLLDSGAIKKGSYDYYEGQVKIQEFTQAIYEASTELIEMKNQLAQIQFDKIQYMIDGFDRKVSKLDAHISLMESRDQAVPESMYKSQMDTNNATIKQQKSLRDKYMKQQSVYAVNSKEYQEYAEKINDVEKEIYGLMEANEKLKDNIFELRFEPLDKAIEKYHTLRDETDSFYSLLNEEAFFDKNGKGTADLAAGLALIQQSMGIAKQEISDYTTGLEKLEKSYKNGVISQEEFNEKSEEYRQGLQNSVKDVEQYKQSLSDLYLKQMEKENEVLQKLISKRKEALKSKADYYDYDRKLKSATKDVNMLEAQIKALESVNNAATQAEVKRLKQQLEDAKQERDDLQRDHAQQMQEQGYDAMSEDLDKVLEDTEYSIIHSTDKQEEVISSMLDRVVQNYKDAYGKINSIIGNTGWVGTSDFNKNQSQLGSQSGAQSQVDNASKDQSSVSSSGTASGTVTDKINNNDSYNSSLENSISKDPNTTNRKVAELTVKPTSLTLMEGKSSKITTSIRPTDAKNKKLSWKSSNTKIATVSNGTVKAVKAGSCKITVSTTDGSGISKTITVKVTAKPKPAKPSTDKGNNKTGGDGVPKVGDKVTFVSGDYYYSSDGLSPLGHQYLGKQVYITRITNASWARKKYHISTGSSLGNGDLGWVDLSQLKGYATGSKKITSPGLAKFDENGSELIIRRGGDKYTTFQYNDGVVPANLTQNLFDLATHKNELLKEINTTAPGVGAKVEQHFDNLISVEVKGDMTKDTLPPLKELLKKSCDYTLQHLYEDVRKIGIRPKR